MLRDAVATSGVDVDAVAAEVASGRPLKTLAEEHTEAVKRWAMFGVPTFCLDDDRAVFVRVMERNRPEDIDAVIDLFPFERLNEYKFTRIPR